MSGQSVTSRLPTHCMSSALLLPFSFFQYPTFLVTSFRVPLSCTTVFTPTSFLLAPSRLILYCSAVCFTVQLCSTTQTFSQFFLRRVTLSRILSRSRSTTQTFSPLFLRRVTLSRILSRSRSMTQTFSPLFLRRGKHAGTAPFVQG